MKPKKGTSTRRKVLVLLGATIAALLLFEVAVRLRQHYYYGTLDRLATFVRHESGLRMPIPNTSRKGVDIDEHGFRSPPLQTPKPEGRRRLAFVGGSTTFCAEVSKSEASWPYVLVDRLRQELQSADIDFFNASVVGFTAESSKLNLEHRVRQHEPDIIVIYHGTNDIGKHARVLAGEQGLWKPSADEENFLERSSMAWRMLVRQFTFAIRSKQTDERAVLDFEVQQITEPFRASMTDLVRTAKRLTPHVVLLEFAQRVRREQSAEERHEACASSMFYTPFMTPDALLESFEAYNQVIREVGAAEGVFVVPDEPKIPADSEHYNDTVHLLDAGCKLFGERVARAILTRPDLRAALGAE